MKSLKVISLIMSIFIAFCTGCAGLIADMAASTYPTYKETTEQWPALKDGQCRIVVYLPREEIIEGVALEALGVLPFHFTNRVEFDNSWKVSTVERTFIFIDLNEGKHQVKFGNYVLEVQVPAGKIIYINGSNPKSFFEEKDVIKSLEPLHHGFKTALPLNEQGSRYEGHF